MPLVACPKCEYEFDSRVASCPKCGEVVTSFVRQHAGTLVDGKYRVLKRLGRGGMGEVFKAEHVHLGTIRVIKVMRPQLADDKELQTRFLREAKLATLIQHPNVATLHDFSVLPDSTCYMVWEYIDGTDLGTWAKGERQVATRDVIELMIQALRGLEAVHAAGIVHRDISPENIMVSTTSSGMTVKLIDLGIAKSDSNEGSLTSTGAFMGKWRYASPEHLGLLEPDEKIDGRADIFSMGIVFYELLSGQLPFQAETPGQYVLLHTGNKPGPVTPDRISVPDAPGLEKVLARMLDRNRNQRYASAAQVISDLEGMVRGVQEYDAAPPTMVLTPRPPEAREPEPEQGSTEPSTVRTQSGAPGRGSSSRALLVFASIAGFLAIVIAAILVIAVIRLRRGSEIKPRAGLTATRSTPAGEVVEIPAEPSTSPSDPPSETATAATTSVATTVEEEDHIQPAGQVQSTTVPPATPAKPVQQKPPPPPTVQPRKTETEPLTKASPTPALVSDSIPTSGKPMFGRRSRKLVDDPSYRDGFRKGIIRDYSDMWSRGGLDWVSLAKAVRLADYRINVSKFRNMTPFKDEAMMDYLNDVLQTELDDVTEPGGTLTTENAIFWAQETPKYGIGIEMIFRDSSGRVVAKIRHTHYEDSLEDAAQEMVDYIVEFVEDQEVVE